MRPWSKAPVMRFSIKPRSMLFDSGGSNPERCRRSECQSPLKNDILFFLLASFMKPKLDAARLTSSCASRMCEQKRHKPAISDADNATLVKCQHLYRPTRGPPMSDQECRRHP